MNKVLKFSVISVCLATSFAAIPSLAEDKHEKHEVHWDYKGSGKPENWGKLKEEYRTCDTSKEQSPINIDTTAVSTAPLAALEFNYAAGPAEVVNNGHTIQINVNEGSSLKIGEDSYKFLQFHFHTPSEEKINGKAYPLVAHLVHKNDAGKLAVVAVLMKMGKKNEALAPIFADLPASKEVNGKLPTFNAKDILPADQKYYAFMGSLTTPPCSDGVRWQVLKNPIEISFGQLKAFKKLYRKNARPIQALNGRTVQVSQ